MMPTSYIRILNDTGHVAIFPFQFAVIVKFRHHDRCENTVFGSRLTDVGKTALITLSSVTARHRIIASRIAILIPAHEVHPYVIHTQVVVMLEKAIDMENYP